MTTGGFRAGFKINPNRERVPSVPDHGHRRKPTRRDYVPVAAAPKIEKSHFSMADIRQGLGRRHRMGLTHAVVHAEHGRRRK